MKRLICGATIVHPGLYKQEDILICNGKIDQMKEYILRHKDMEIIDGSDYFVLQGFISSCRAEASQRIGQGISTIIKDIKDTEYLEMENEEHHEEEHLDFVYHVHLARWDKKKIEWLGSKRIKLISVSELPSEPKSWIPQLERMGFVVLDMDTNKKDIETFKVPYVATYPSQTKPRRSRMVIRIQKAAASTWLKQAIGKKTLFPASYWLDVLDLRCPIAGSEEHLKELLYTLAHCRSRVPAKVLGIFPRKGSITIGADADLLFFKRDKLFQVNEEITPEKVMIGGTWAGELLEHGRKHVGSYIQANRTYAFDY